MSSTETQNGLTVRRYSVLFAVMIFAAVFMPTKFFWLPPVALFVLFITSKSWKWRGFGAFVVMPFCVVMFAPAPQFVYDLDNKIASLNATPRFELYQAVIMDIITQPWFGYVRDAARIDHSAFQFGAIAHYPHNFILQIWLEMGVFGVVLFVWFLATVLHAIQKISLQYRFYILGAFFCALCPVTFSYNLWSGWVVALFCITFWLFILFGHEVEKTSTSTQ